MAVKNYSNGDIFGGADMDSLVRSSNIRFASSAERASVMVGDLAPFNGATSFLTDTKTMTRYNGTAWAIIPPVVMFGWAAQSTAAAHTVYTTVSTYQVNLLGSYNYANWFNPATGQFQPALAGYYEFVGGACFDNGSSGTAGGGLRSVGLRIGGAALLAPSVCTVPGPGQNFVTTVSMRPYVHYMNGTTDAVAFGVHQSSGVTASLMYNDTGPMWATYFSGKYLGG